MHDEPRFPAARAGNEARVELALGLAILAVLVLSVVLVAVVLVWAARADGREDRAVQARLGIRRRTRLGR